MTCYEPNIGLTTACMGLQDVPWVEEQLSMLGTLLPDLIAKLPKMKAALLVALVEDTQVCGANHI